MSKKTRILLFGLGIVYMISTYGFYRYWSLVNQQEDELSQNYISHAMSLSENIASQFFERYGDAKVFSLSIKNPLIRKENFQQLLNQYVSQYIIYDSILVVDSHGKYLASSTMDSKGNHLDVSQLKLQNFQDENWFKYTTNKIFTEDARKGLTGVFVDDVGIDKVTSLIYKEPRYGNSFSTPIYDDQNNIIAILSTRTNFSWVEKEYLKLYQILTKDNKSSIELTMLDKKGNIIIDFDPSFQVHEYKSEIKNQNVENFEFKHDFKILNHFNLVSNNVLAANYLIQGLSGTVISHHARKKIEQLSSFTPVRSNKFVNEIGWGILIRLDVREAFSTTLYSKRQIAISLVLFLLVMIGTSLLFVRYSKEKDDQERDLVSAKNTAESATKAKTEFLANMSHEIRTPLHAILGMAELLSESPLSEEQQKYVGIFRRAGETLLMVVNDILDISKIEFGNLELEQIDFNLKQVVEDTLEILQNKANDKNLLLVMEYSKDLSEYFIGDPFRVRQIISNLISNAIKFSSKGIVYVRVQNNTVTTHGNILISVKDEGMGISEKQIEKLFKPFSQVDSSISRKHGGTGLGLSLCKKLTEMMNGRIWVFSRKGEGSTFFFTLELPVHNRENEDHTTPNLFSNETVSKVQAPLLSGDERKNKEMNQHTLTQSLDDGPNKSNDFSFEILLVDDSEDNRLLIKSFLKSSNHRITEAENGLQAFEKVKLKRYDIILMDIQMPLMDGYESTRLIRKWEKETGTPAQILIALTAHALNEEKLKSIEMGCDRHITKPINKHTLLQLLSQLSKSTFYESAS